MSCDWLTPKQAAGYIKVTPSTVYRWIRRGELTYYTTPGGTIRICKSDLVRDSEANIDSPC